MRETAQIHRDRLPRNAARRRRGASARQVALTVAAPILAAAVLATGAAEFEPSAAKADARASGPAPLTHKKAAWGVTEHDGVSLFPIYRDLGVGIFQTQARWDAIAPSRPANPTDPDDPAYVWPDYLDRTIAEAASQGITVAIQIIGAPGWATGGRAWNWAPHEPADFGAFAAAISRRYPSVRLWMVWGEPNSKRAFAPVKGAKATSKTKLRKKQRRAPRLYAQMLDAAYGALKGVNSENKVIGGNTFQGAGHPVIRTYQWIRYLKLPGGRRPRMDMWGHNPYTYRKPNLRSRPSPRGRVDFSDLRRLAKRLDEAFPKPRLKLFLSEWGIPTRKGDPLQFHVKPRTAKRWVHAAFRIVRKWKRIYTLGWSVPVDTDRNPQGLLDSDLRPKPAYWAFKNGL